MSKTQIKLGGLCLLALSTWLQAAPLKVGVTSGPHAQIQSDEVRTYINERFKGAVIAAF